MAIDLLGPLRIDGNEASLQRRDEVVLAALALRPGCALAADQLAGALWGDEPPPSWPKVVQGCVMRLRRAITHERIDTTPAGYRLDMTGDDLDTRRFEAFIERGRTLAIAGDVERAANAFGSALGLWRGQPFAALDGWPPGRAETMRFEELRRAAEERWLDARLEAGEHREVAAIARGHVSEEPLREHRWATLALAQYRCGQQADALRSIRQARHTLLEQLGVEPGIELTELEAAILRQDDTLAPPPALSPIAEQCPYKGLAPYDVDDTDVFFGRDGEISSCLARLRSTPLLVVTGPSGCGKSSLVRAGLVPALLRDGRRAAVFAPGSDPDAVLTTSLAATPGCTVLVVDQFEELFTNGDDIEARSFCRRLLDHCTTREAVVVVAVRADHVASMAVAPEFARLAERGVHIVMPLTGDGLREAIEGPARLAGLRLESGLIELLVRETDGEPGALPLLSHALVETWRRRDGRVLTIAGYQATGEIRGAVARSADRLYDSLPAAQRPKLRSMLLRLVASSPDGEPVRSRVAIRSLEGDADRERVLGLLISARLVTADDDSVELAHEALARAWPRLRSWLDEDAAGQRILRHLSAAAAGWESLGRPPTELYRGARLDATSEWRAATSPDLTTEETAFLDASVAESTSEREQMVLRARVQQRQNRRLRRSLVGLAILLVVALVGGLVAFQQRQAAQREQRTSALGALVGNSAALRTNRRDLAALLAVEAHRMAPSAATESALFGTFTTAPGAERLVHTEVDLNQLGAGAVYVPGTETMALIDGRGAVHLVDLPTGEQEPLGAALADAADATYEGAPLLAIDQSGRYLAALWRRGGSFVTVPGYEYSLMTVWDLRTRERRFEPVRVPYRVGSLAMSADGSLLVVGGGYLGQTQIRDGATGGVRTELDPLPRPDDANYWIATAAAAFAPDGRLVVTSQAGPIRVIDPHTGSELQRIEAPQETGEEVVFFNRAGTEIVSVGSEGVVGFDLESGAPLWPEPLRLPYCTAAAYAERIGSLLCGEGSGRVVAYDLPSGVELGRRFDTQHGHVCSIVPSADGASFAVVSSCLSNATIAEWRLDGGGSVSRNVVDTPENVTSAEVDFTNPVYASHHPVAFGFAGNPDALVAEFAAEGDHTRVPHVIEASTGVVLDRLPELHTLLLTDNAQRAVGYFVDGTVGWYDTERRSRVGTGIEPGLPVEWIVGDDDLALVAGYDDGTLLQAIDLESGHVRSPVIDGRSKFDVLAVAIGAEAMYTALYDVDAVNGDPVFQVQRRDLDDGAVLGDPAVGYFTVATSGGVVVASATDGRVVELDPDSLAPVGQAFPGANGSAVSLALDEHGRRLMVLGEDQTLRFYDVATRTQLGDAIDLDIWYEMAGAVLRGDGLMAAADTGQGIVVWDLDPAHWVDAACRLAGRNLTHAEWDQYIGDLAPYRATCPAYPAD